jgi:hypothetical protein
MVRFPPESRPLLYSTLGLPQPKIQRVEGALSPGIERPAREANQSSPYSAEVKNDGTIIPLPHTPSWRHA